MTELEVRQQKIVVALFLLLGKAYTMLNQQQRMQLKCTESEISKAWNEKKSPVRVISEQVPMRFSQYGNFSEDEEWKDERRYSVMMGDLDLRNVSPGFASVPMPKADPTDPAKDKEKSRVFQLE